MVPAVSPGSPLFSILCAVSFGVVPHVGQFFFFFDFAYCSPAVVQFPLSCFSLNACDDLLSFPLSTSYDTLIYMRLFFALFVPAKKVYSFSLLSPSDFSSPSAFPVLC
jgi:hypothetical protein